MNQENLILMYLQKIEKAICMPNRRAVFSQNIVLQLIEMYLSHKSILLPEIIQGILKRLISIKNL